MKTYTAVCALLWENPVFGKIIGRAFVSGYDKYGNYKQEERPIYSNSAAIYSNFYNNCSVSVVYYT